jgi:ATP-dependent helicase HrpB
LLSLLDWDQQQSLKASLPTHLTVPSGSSIQIDYSTTPPVLAVKLQEMFGYEGQPSVLNGRLPLMLHLLSPARRPLQVTQDLPHFWRNTYADVRKDMRGRYPRHPWPEDPMAAEATRYTKRRT